VRSIRYFDFDLLIEPAGDPGRYEARVIKAPSGEFAPVRFSSPFSELELENFLLKIGRRRNVVRSLDTQEGETVKEFGGRLFDSVFAGDVRIALATSLSETDSDDLGLRVRLRLNECPELADLPWEYLYDRSTRRFLALSEWTPVVRYLDLPGRVHPLAVDGPLRILGLVSSPSDYPTLSVQDEWAKLETSLGGLVDAGRVQLTKLPDGRLASLNRALRRDDFHVFHYIGHGGLLPGGQDGVIVLQDDNGRGIQVSGADLGVSLHDHRTLRLAVLNSCEGARAGIADPYSGTAQTLVQQGLPAVVAMQFEITDEAAVTFSQALYEAIADGYPLDASMAEARKAIRNEPNATEWGTPVLYLRAPDGRIFDMAAPVGAAASPTGGAAATATERPERPTASAVDPAPPKPRPSDGETTRGETGDGETRDGETPDGETGEGKAGDGETTRRRPWPWIAGGAAALVLAAGVVALVAAQDDETPSTDGTSPGATSSQGTSSAAGRSDEDVLAGAAEPYFSSDECNLATPEDAQFAFTLPLSLRIQCNGSTGYNGLFWCADSLEHFNQARDAFLGEAVTDKVDLSNSPAGSDNMVDGVQEAYLHKGDRNARVYWDSASAMCGAVLQAPDSDIGAAVGLWRDGAQ
jgi:hypothetical protein